MLAVLSATAPTALPEPEPPSATAAAVPGLIVDTDIGGGGCRDVDDVGALGVANALADSGVVNLLGVVQNTQATNSTGVISVVQRYYSRTIPTGVYRGSGLRDLAALPYVADIVARWPSPVRNSSQAGSAVKLYRHLLAGQPDRSVAVASIGLLTNLAALFQSSADEHSPLSGLSLFGQKVFRLAIMGGRYPSSKGQRCECNFCAAAWGASRAAPRPLPELRELPSPAQRRALPDVRRHRPPSSGAGLRARGRAAARGRGRRLQRPRGGAEGRHRRGALDVRAGRLAAASGLRRLRRRSRPRALLVGPHHDARCRSRWPAGREALLGLRRRQRRGRVLGRQRVEARPSRQPDLPRPGGRGRRATGDRPTALPAAAAGCKRAQRRSLCCFCTSRAHRVTYE